MIKNLLSFAAVAALAVSSVNAETLDLSLADLGAGWGSSYDAETKTITYDSDWSGRGWWLGDVDYSAYDEVVVEFEPVEFDIQVVIQYNAIAEGGTEGISEATMGTAGASKIVAPLNADIKNSVKQIYVQSSKAGTVTLKAAYLQNAAVVDPDAVKELWSGDQALDWWENAIKIPVASFVAAKIKAGDKLEVSYVNTGDAAAQKYCNLKVQLLLANWDQAILPGFALCEGFQEQYGTVNISEASGVFSITLGEDDVKELTDATANQSLMFVGENITVTKIDLVPAKSPTVGIDNVAVDENAPVEYYNLQGVKVANPANGIYVVRQGDKVSKVLVK